LRQRVRQFDVSDFRGWFCHVIISFGFG